MTRSPLFAYFLAPPLLASLVMAGAGSAPAWEPQESLSPLFRPTVAAGQGQALRASATLARWKIPSRAAADIASKSYVSGSRQPLGVRPSLIPIGRTSGRDEGVLSVQGFKEGACSIKVDAGFELHCSTSSTGCRLPEGPLTPEGR